MPGVMITNGGPHSPEKWAFMTGDHIFPIDQVRDGERLMMAREAQTAIIRALIPHVQAHQETERATLASVGEARLGMEDSASRASQALVDVKAALVGTPWADKATDDAWAKAVFGELQQHLNTVQNIEQQWHAHRNPTVAATTWLACHNLKRD